MSAAKSKFDITLSVDIEEVEGGEAKPFAQSDMKYSDMRYEGVVTIEESLVDAMKTAHALCAEVIGEDRYKEIKKMVRKASKRD